MANTKQRTEPRIGDTRVVTKLAWWPVTCSDGKTRWLERVRVHQMWLSWESADQGGFPEVSYGWKNMSVSPE